MLSKILNQLILLCLILVSSTWIASAERLPIKTYTIADGLARNDVGCIKQDSHGFLWFCTGEGISRFDGYSFINYGTNAGLSSRNTNDLIESRNGDYFVATNDGLSRLSSNSFTGSAEKMFQVYRPEGAVFARSFNVLVEVPVTFTAGQTAAFTGSRREMRQASSRGSTGFLLIREAGGRLDRCFWIARVGFG